MLTFRPPRSTFTQSAAREALRIATCDWHAEADMETWATFSIIDHRAPVYRQALALFDGIVVPIPPHPIGDQTAEELEQLSTEVEYLAQHGAAKAFLWSQRDFAEWRQPFLAEAAAAGLNRDAFQDTRLRVADALKLDGVQAVPVYADEPSYERARDALMAVDQVLTTKIMQRLIVPDDDTALEDLVRLRNDNEAFQQALHDLLEWKQTQVLLIAHAENRGARIEKVMKDFDRLTGQYAKTMQAAGFRRVVNVASIFLSAATGDLIGAVKEGAVGYQESIEPSWKKISEMKCAPGGVVYHFKAAVV
jgi:phage-related protein